MLGSPSSYMTLQLLHSECPYIWGKFYFLFYQCSYDNFMRFCHIFGLLYIQKVLGLKPLFLKLTVFLYDLAPFVLISPPFHFILFHSIYFNYKHSIRIFSCNVPEFAENAIGLKIPFYFSPHPIMVFPLHSHPQHSIPFHSHHSIILLAWSPKQKMPSD